jgi:hypothetical protein
VQALADRGDGVEDSLFNMIPITGHTDLRFNAGFFNVLKHPGNPNTIRGAIGWRGIHRLGRRHRLVDSE